MAKEVFHYENALAIGPAATFVDHLHWQSLIDCSSFGCIYEMAGQCFGHHVQGHMTCINSCSSPGREGNVLEQNNINPINVYEKGVPQREIDFLIQFRLRFYFSC